MNLPIAVPGHVGEDGVWLEFVAPDGKRFTINVTIFAQLADDTDMTLTQWCEAHQAAYRAANKG